MNRFKKTIQIFVYIFTIIILIGDIQLVFLLLLIGIVNLSKQENMSFKSKLKLFYYRLRYKYQEIKLKLRIHFSELNRKGKERLTIMVIPHSEDKTLNFHISYRTISVFIGFLFFLMFVSAINVLNHSSLVHELTELNLSNKDFIHQTAKIKNEIEYFHSNVQYYHKNLADLYIVLGGDPVKVAKGVGGAETIGDAKVASLDSKIYQLKNDINDLKVSNELSKSILTKLKKKQNILKHTPSIWPAKGYVHFPYGVHLNPNTGRRERNNGIDIVTFPDAQVFSTAPGIIYDIQKLDNGTYFVKVAHKFGWKTIYTGLERVKVKKNQLVSKSEIIGFVGKSKTMKEYTLHYEVHVGTNTVDPTPFLNKLQDY